MTDLTVELNGAKKSFNAKKYSRRATRDAIKGSDAIKRANSAYLPIPNGYLHDDTSPSQSRLYTQRVEESDAYAYADMPWYHTNAAYAAYLQRARYPELVIIALNGLIGTATKKPADVELPTQIEYLIENASDDGQSIHEVFAMCVMEALIAGNVAPTVEVDTTTNKLYFKIVKAEIIPDWDESAINELSFVNIRTKTNSRSLTTYKVEEIEKNYIYAKDLTNGEVSCTEYTDGEKSEPVVISLQGTKADIIPMFPIGSQINSLEPQQAPLYGLAEIALAIYRKDADLSNAQYMTCNPNLVITGADSDLDDDGNETGVPNIVGSQSALIISSPDAKVYYTDTDTSALDHMREAIKDLFFEATMYAVSIVGNDKGGAEAAETVKMRQGANNATLVNIVNNCAKAIKDGLKFCARMSGADENAVVFSATTDFAEKYISPDLMRALTDVWIARGLSLETLLKRFKDAGLLDKDEDIAKEMARIQNETPVA